MADALRLISTIQAANVRTYAATDTDAWEEHLCWYCGGKQMVVIAAYVDGNYRVVANQTRWLRCVSCLRGAVVEAGVLYPSGNPLRAPLGLPPTDAAIWAEVRSCLGVGANSAAVMLCRKLLLHVAVSNGLSPKDDRDRAPNFTESIRHLKTVGLVTERMSPWVERIKDVGNDANHEITPIATDDALDVATFTQQLLVLAYELDAIMGNPKLAEQQ